MAKLHDIEIDDWLKTCIDIEPLALEEEFVRLPADYAYWNARFSTGLRAFNVAKVALERIDARLHIEMRETLMAQAKEAADTAAEILDAAAEAEVASGKKAKAKPKVSIKSPTVDDISAAKQSCKEYQDAQDALLDAEVEKARLYGVLKSIEFKRDSLIQLGAKVRVEMQHDPVIRDQARVDALNRG